MCGTVEHLSISACADDLNLLDDNVNIALLYIKKKHQTDFCFDCKETGTEKEAEKISRY
jgi:hypothetical protein